MVGRTLKAAYRTVRLCLGECPMSISWIARQDEWAERSQGGASGRCDHYACSHGRCMGVIFYYLSHIRHELYVPVDPDRGPGYGGLGGPFPWPANVHEVPCEDVSRQQFDCVLFQSADHYLSDQHTLLSAEQRRLPRIYLEHDPPRKHPTDTRHVVADIRRRYLFTSTPFNALMWDAGDADVRVIQHGVTIPSDVEYPVRSSGNRRGQPPGPPRPTSRCETSWIEPAEMCRSIS